MNFIGSNPKLDDVKLYNVDNLKKYDKNFQKSTFFHSFTFFTVKARSNYDRLFLNSLNGLLRVMKVFFPYFFAAINSQKCEVIAALAYCKNDFEFFLHKNKKRSLFVTLENCLLL